jgi:FkbM family methyltransferase
MADRIKPHVVERVKIIRQWEKDMGLLEAKDIGFKKYHNYYAPKKLIRQSEAVLSFGVGGDCKFEKLLLHENDQLKVAMFDPTPYTIRNIEGIIRSCGRKEIDDITRNNFLSRKIKFMPWAYSHESGKQNFYYDPNKEDHDRLDLLTQSFSLIPQNKTFKSVTVECKNIRSIMAKLEWDSVDIIKADIEGLWREISDEILDNNINIKMLATEFELIFDDIHTALAKAKAVVEKFESHGYKAFLNRKRDKLMLEMLFIRRDLYEG